MECAGIWTFRRQSVTLHLCNPACWSGNANLGGAIASVLFPNALRTPAACRTNVV